MKKQLLFLALVSCTMSLYSQVEKGKFSIGTRLDVAGGMELALRQQRTGLLIGRYNSIDEEKNKIKVFSIHFTPELGYNILDNLMVGGAVDYIYYKIQDVKLGETAKETIFTGGPFIRYYFHTPLRLRPYLGLEANFGKFETQATGATQEDDKVGLNIFGGNTGLAYFFDNGIGVDFGIQAMSIIQKRGDLHSTQFTESWSAGFIWLFHL